ncbi:anhydro-N-acetylmuramic acid kinase, partial [uncultured Agrococcus sp.]|uniref:anhydro-N-acetylmuramic acid kinase n=1 Tax=uncultured Agrococcus sp. TaxID=382258 RepID=UPI0025F23C08
MTVRVLGMISGTSHDGIDCAVVEFQLVDDALEARTVHRASVPYSSELRSQLVAALPPAAVPLSIVTELDARIGKEFAVAAEAVIDAVGPVDLICSHGQTVFHWVREGTVHGSLQLGQPAWIAEGTGAPVLSDVRARDIAAGGHGAPLVPVL